MTTLYTHIDSPLGPLLITADGDMLTRVYMNNPPDGANVGAGWLSDPGAPVLAEAKRQLDAFFAGTRTEFDLPLAPRGSDFQLRVWQELKTIAYGETVSYGDIARRIGLPNASRAVGLANGSNPISIIVPCHRVIGANGKLTGYGGGIQRKAALLDFERSVRTIGPQPMPPLT